MAIFIKVPKGEILYPDDNKLPPIIYVLCGKLCVNYIDEDGIDFVAHYVMPRSLCYEGIWCMSGQMDNMPLKVMEDSQLLLFDSALTCSEYAMINPLLVENMLYSQAIKNLTYSHLRLINSYKSPLVKVARFIYAMWSLHHASIIPTGVTQGELALLLHMHKVTFANAIAQLKRRGALKKLTKSRVIIGNPSILHQLANPCGMD